MSENHPILETVGLTRRFTNPSRGDGRQTVTAVDKLDLKIHSGELISLVGQSGSGKTTLGRMLLGLQPPSEGKILFNGKPIPSLKPYWKEVQAVFQDPFSAFNQFFTIEAQLRNCRKIMGDSLSKEAFTKRMDEALRTVHLNPERVKHKYTFELSGGQMQRLLIARIFLIQPKVLIADEPTSMVDACSRSSILNELLKLQQLKNMTILFITHDLGMARYVSDRILIMHRGKIVESGKPGEIIDHPKHPYTQQLLKDIPTFHKPWLDRQPPKPVNDQVFQWRVEPSTVE